MQRQFTRQYARAEMQVILVAPAAIDVDAVQGFEVGLVLADQVDRIVFQPLLPARRQEFSRFQVKRKAETQGRAGIRIVGRGHGDFHQRMSFGLVQLFLRPNGVEKALDASIVAPGGRAARILGHVDLAGAPSRSAIAIEFVQRARPVGEVAEVEVGVAGMVGDGAPVLRVFHAMDDCTVTSRGLAETATMVA